MHRTLLIFVFVVSFLAFCHSSVELSVVVDSCFLVNSADRTIRVYESGEVLACGKDGEPEPIQKLQDLVNRFITELCLAA